MLLLLYSFLLVSLNKVCVKEFVSETLDDKTLKKQKSILTSLWNIYKSNYNYTCLCQNFYDITGMQNKIHNHLS